MKIPWDSNENPLEWQGNHAAMAMEIPREFRAKGIKIVTPSKIHVS